MGTKGLSAALWLFFLLLAAAAFHPVLFGAALFLAVLIFKHWFYDLPRARRNSAAMGLQEVILLPVNRCWAALLLRISGGARLVKHLRCGIKAYEVHIAGRRKSFRETLRQVEKDMFLIKEKVPGLYLWETSAPVPRSVRREIARAVEAGRAFQKPGGYPVPRFPGTQLELRRKRHHGALIHAPAKGDDRSAQS